MDELEKLFSQKLGVCARLVVYQYLFANPGLTYRTLAGEQKVGHPAATATAAVALSSRLQRHLYTTRVRAGNGELEMQHLPDVAARDHRHYEKGQSLFSLHYSWQYIYKSVSVLMSTPLINTGQPTLYKSVL